MRGRVVVVSSPAQLWRCRTAVVSLSLARPADIHSRAGTTSVMAHSGGLTIGQSSLLAAASGEEFPMDVQIKVGEWDCWSSDGSAIGCRNLVEGVDDAVHTC